MTELEVIDPAECILTHLTRTPWDGRKSKQDTSDGDIGLDRTLMPHIGVNEKGTTLQILFTGIVKQARQYKLNWVLNFVPLTWLGWMESLS